MYLLNTKDVGKGEEAEAGSERLSDSREGTKVKLRKHNNWSRLFKPMKRQEQFHQDGTFGNPCHPSYFDIAPSYGYVHTLHLRLSFKIILIITLHMGAPGVG